MGIFQNKILELQLHHVLIRWCLGNYCGCIIGKLWTELTVKRAVYRKQKIGIIFKKVCQTSSKCLQKERLKCRRNLGLQGMLRATKRPFLALSVGKGGKRKGRAYY